MKKVIAIILLLGIFATPLFAQQRTERGATSRRTVYDDGDSITMLNIMPVPIFNRRSDLRRYKRMVEAVKRVYPLSVTAREKMQGMEDTLSQMKTIRQQQLYIRRIERELIREYTPVLRKMTRTQGRVLLKLISRQTDHTAYGIVREFRGRIEAGVWQAVAKIFGHDLKSDYDPEGEDRMLEQIVTYYEKGLL